MRQVSGALPLRSGKLREGLGNLVRLPSDAHPLSQPD